MTVRRLTEADVARMVDMRERGLTYGQIAQAVGCSNSAVRWRLLQEGVDAPRPARLAPVPTGSVEVQRRGFVIRRFTVEEDQRLLELERQGKTLAEVGRLLGRKRHSVLGRLMSLARRAERQEAAAS